nr:15059_t:CDS:2 [Entrophospora candida]
MSEQKSYVRKNGAYNKKACPSCKAKKRRCLPECPGRDNNNNNNNNNVIIINNVEFEREFMTEEKKEKEKSECTPLCSEREYMTEEKKEKGKSECTPLCSGHDNYVANSNVNNITNNVLEREFMTEEKKEKVKNECTPSCSGYDNYVANSTNNIIFNNVLDEGMANHLLNGRRNIGFPETESILTGNIIDGFTNLSNENITITTNFGDSRLKINSEDSFTCQMMRGPLIPWVTTPWPNFEFEFDNI